MTDPHPVPPEVAVIGGGPAGLMAAEIVAGGGAAVTVFDRMPSVARKLLMAGRGGLNLTHSEDLAHLLDRYGPARAVLAPVVTAFPPADLITWCNALGQPTFVGSSGRVFPSALKASPLLRAWLTRLERLGVQIRTRHEWRGWNETGALTFELGPDEIEIGMGAHGEPGISRQKLTTADAITEQMMAAILPDLPFRSGDEVALLINNLGATTMMELLVVNRCVRRILGNAGIAVHRTDVGSFLTCQEMAGLSVTLLRLDDELKRYLDMPAASLAYTSN